MSNPSFAEPTHSDTTPTHSSVPDDSTWPIDESLRPDTESSGNESPPPSYEDATRRYRSLGSYLDESGNPHFITAPVDPSESPPTTAYTACEPDGTAHLFVKFRTPRDPMASWLGLPDGHQPSQSPPVLPWMTNTAQTEPAATGTQSLVSRFAGSILGPRAIANWWVGGTQAAS